MIHCSDILDALTKNFLGTSDSIEQAVPLEDLKKGKPNNYEPWGTTLQLQREHYSSKMIQRGFRQMLSKIKEKKEQDKIEQGRQASCDTNLTPVQTPKATAMSVKDEILKLNLAETIL